MDTKHETIYLDNNATTAVDPRVLEAMMPYLTHRFGNAASRTHAYGWEAESAVDDARADIAKLIGAKPDEIVFTSGATESTNIALKGVAEHYADRGDHVITVATEHKATLDTCDWLERQGKRVTVLPVDRAGRIDLDRLEAAMDDGTILVSLMMVNNEIGVVHPVAEIGALCNAKNVLFHCDVAQAFGKLPIDVMTMGIHLLSVSGHKIYAPKGVGVLYARQRNPKIKLTELIHGGGHEGGMRSGTLNVPGIVGLGAAAAIAAKEMGDEAERVQTLGDRLRSRLEEGLGELTLNGDADHRIHGNLNLSIPGIDSGALLVALPRVAVSSGSACNSDLVEPSYVLKALGLDNRMALSAVRFGVGRFNTQDEIDQAADLVVEAVRSLRGEPRSGRKDMKASAPPTGA